LTFFLGHDATSVEVDVGSMIKVVVGGGGGIVVERAELIWLYKLNNVAKMHGLKMIEKKYHEY